MFPQKNWQEKRQEIISENDTSEEVRDAFLKEGRQHINELHTEMMRDSDYALNFENITELLTSSFRINPIGANYATGLSKNSISNLDNQNSDQNSLSSSDDVISSAGEMKQQLAKRILSERSPEIQKRRTLN